MNLTWRDFDSKPMVPMGQELDIPAEEVGDLDKNDFGDTAGEFKFDLVGLTENQHTLVDVRGVEHGRTSKCVPPPRFLVVGAFKTSFSPVANLTVGNVSSGG
eukprot:GABV01001094.1.p3 GENE.GABV01001094.1~~GABV01001094.1.p3  ORF type:complete len:102 (-),score=38.16 GABV01001094.1:355-660(-)